MKLQNEKVRNQKFYFVGYEEETRRYVLGIVITWVSWYNRYYEITEEEYRWFDTDVEKLDSLAEACYRQGPCGDRFIRSDYMAENSADQGF